MNLNDMPDDVLIRLLKTAAPHDVTRARRLNKRFNKLVETYNLGRPRVKEFCVESRVAPIISPNKIGRLRLGPPPPAKRRLVMTMKGSKGSKMVERIDEPSSSTQLVNQFVGDAMRKVVLDEKLSFDGITIDDDFFRVLTARNNDMRHVTTLALSLCHLRISTSQWMELLGRMSIQHLYVDFCTFDPSLFSDKVMMSLPHLVSLQIQPRYPCFLNELTDQTLLHWATRGAIPSSVLLRNGCASRMTPEGIRMIMTSSMARGAQKLDWDFGLLAEPTQFDSFLLFFCLSPEWKLSATDDFRSRCIQLKRASSVFQFRLPVPFPLGSLSSNP